MNDGDAGPPAAWQDDRGRERERAAEAIAVIKAVISGTTPGVVPPGIAWLVNLADKKKDETKRMDDEERRTLDRAAAAGDAAAADALGDLWSFNTREGFMYAPDDAALDRAEARGLRPTMKLQYGDFVAVRPKKRGPQPRSTDALDGLPFLGIVTSTDSNSFSSMRKVRILAVSPACSSVARLPQEVEVYVADDEVIVLRRDGLPPRKPVPT